MTPFAPVQATTRSRFWRRVLTHCFSPTPYVWGGKTATGLDCSGLVTLSLYEASDNAVDWRKTHNTDALWRLPPVEESQLEVGDLVLYWGEHSRGSDDVAHVMVWAGAGLVVGQAWGGPDDTNPVMSRALGKVSQVKPVNYRSDIAGYRRIPLL